jgi:hypothetical protein
MELHGTAAFDAVHGSDLIHLTHMPSAASSIRAAVVASRDDGRATGRIARCPLPHAARCVWVRMIGLVRVALAAPSIRAAVARAKFCWCREAMREHRIASM